MPTSAPAPAISDITIDIVNLTSARIHLPNVLARQADYVLFQEHSLPLPEQEAYQFQLKQLGFDTVFSPLDQEKSKATGGVAMSSLRGRPAQQLPPRNTQPSSTPSR